MGNVKFQTIQNMGRKKIYRTKKKFANELEKQVPYAVNVISSDFKLPLKIY